MSVVNKMLKDLENREAHQAAPANYQPPAKKSTNLPRLILIILIGSIAIGLVVFWPQSEPAATSSQTVTPINRAVTSADEPVQPVPAEVAESVQQDTESTPPKAEPVTQLQAATSAALPVVKKTVSQPVPSTALTQTQSQPSDAGLKPVAKPVIKPSQGDTKASLKEQIRLAISDNDTDTAIRLLRTLILQQPDNAGARKRLAALYFSEGRVTDAQKLLQQTVVDMPADSSVRLMYARLLVQQKDPKMAYYVLQDVDQHGLPSIELLGYRASLAQQLSLFDDALKDYANLVTQDRENAKWWLGQAVVADKQGQTTLAKSSYREALKLQQLKPSIEQFIRQRLGNLTGVSQ